MNIIDAHYHLWDRAQVPCRWLEAPGEAFHGDNRKLPQPYDVAAFLRDAQGVALEASVHVEAIPDSALSEARWLQAQAEKPESLGHPHGIVAMADLSSDDAPALLEQLSDLPNLRGIRQILNVHRNPTWDYVGRHYMAEPRWRENLGRLARLNFSFDLQIYPSQVALACEVIDAHPGITFIVNHTGMFVDRDSVEGWREWKRGLRLLAARDNVAMKISGLAMFDHAWTVESQRPYVLEAIDAFGVPRCMFASNFPVDGLHSSYAALWQAYRQIVAGASEAEQTALFAGSARHWYRLQRG